MLRYKTRGLDESRENQNSLRLEGCLSLHLALSFDPAHSHIWAAFLLYYRARAKSGVGPVVCAYQLMQRQVDDVGGKTPLVLLKEASTKR